MISITNDSNKIRFCLSKTTLNIFVSYVLTTKMSKRSDIKKNWLNFICILSSRETLVIFSGGLPTDKAGRTHSITVLNGKSTTVLEMEHAVVDFVTLCESPHTAGVFLMLSLIEDLRRPLTGFVTHSHGDSLPWYSSCFHFKFQFVVARVKIYQ